MPSAAMFLRFTADLPEAASDIEMAIAEVLNGGYRTPDIDPGNTGYAATTSEIGELVAEAVAEIADMRHAYHAV